MVHGAIANNIYMIKMLIFGYILCIRFVVVFWEHIMDVSKVSKQIVKEGFSHFGIEKEFIEKFC